MAQGNKFCTGCGLPLDPGSRFCASCGQPVVAAVVPPPQYASPPTPPQSQSAPVDGERVIGIMPGLSRKKGLLAVEGYNAVVTERRIVFAVMTNEMVREEAKKDRGGFLANMAGAVTAGYNIWKRYQVMTPEQALSENPQNFAIAMNQIRKVKFDAGRMLIKKGVVTVGVNVNRRADESAHLEIETIAEKFKFDVATHFQEEARTVLNHAGLIK